MTTPESNETSQSNQKQPSAEQHPADGSHTFPPQTPAQPSYAAPPADGPYASPPTAAPASSGQHPVPPQAAQPYPGAQPTAGQPGPYPYPVGQPGLPYGYPMAQPVRTPTGTLSWALGFLIFLLIPFLSGIISGAAMALTFGAAAKHGGVARENARSAANWGLTYVTLSLVLVIGHFIALFAFSNSRFGDDFFPIGIPIMLYFAVSILHVVLVIVGTVKASSGKVMRVPFAIPYIRA